jgi:Putative peptidoglycan binding domain
MKKVRLISLVGITSIVLPHAGWAAGHGGGGGFGGGGFGGGHFGGGGVASRGGGVGFGRPGFSGRPAYYYSRGMHFAGAAPRPGFVGQRSNISAMPNRNRTSVNTHPAQTTRRPTLNGRTDHIAERHDAANWHHNWDRRHAHFFHNRFFVFDDGFWFGLDAGFFPWDYYPYYAYDYYPYDYYPGYYADVEPYYYDEGVDTLMRDPNVSAVQKELSQQGYYNGPIDGVFGPTTRDAVAKYQIAKHLDVTGSLSPDTLQSLGLPQPAAS